MLTSITAVVLFTHIRGCQNLPWLETSFIFIKKIQREESDLRKAAAPIKLVISKKTEKIFKFTTGKGMLKNTLPCGCIWRPFSYTILYLHYIGDLLCSNNLNWNVKPGLKGGKKIIKPTLTRGPKCSNNSTHSNMSVSHGNVMDSHL